MDTTLEIRDIEARVPLALRFFGKLIAISNVLAVLASIFDLVAHENPFAFGYLVISIIFFRLGVSLWEGKRQAVLGLAVMGALGSLFALSIVATGGWAFGLALLVMISILDGIPVYVGFQSWERLC